jgi:hypothetical protein
MTGSNRRVLDRGRCALATLAFGAAWLIAPSAGAVEISNLSVFLDPANTPDLFDDVGSVAEEVASSVGITSSSTTQFSTRYQAGIYTDAGGGGSSTNVTTLSVSYSISFDITDAFGSAWQLEIDTRRFGARTAVTDGNGQSAFGLSAVNVTHSGDGTFDIGTLGLADIPRVQQTTNVNLVFDQSGAGIVSGIGNGSVLLSFDFTATAETIVLFGNQGDEAAIRLGIPSNLSFFTAGEYPGPGVRDPAADGHSVGVTLFDLGPIPEPATALLLGLGLAGLALQGRVRAWRGGSA